MKISPKTILPYLFVCVLGAIITLFESKLEMFTSRNISREIASDCTDLISQLIKVSPKNVTPKTTLTIVKAKTLKGAMWEKLLDPHEFHQFDNIKYANAIKHYSKTQKNLEVVNPKTIEEKLAFIEVLSSKLATDDFKNIMKLSAEIENLSALRLKRMQKLLTKLDLSSKLSTYNIEIFTREFMLILKGPPKKIEDYLLKSNLKMHSRLTRMVQEDIFRIGLEDMIKRIPAKDNYTKIQNLRHMINKLFEYKIVQLYFLPYYLPKVKAPRIPDELVKKILLEGLDKHESELIAIYKKQNRIDDYENFKKIYTPIAYSIGIFYYYHVATEKIIPFIKEKMDQYKVKEQLDNIFVPMSAIAP